MPSIKAIICNGCGKKRKPFFTSGFCTSCYKLWAEGKLPSNLKKDVNQLIIHWDKKL